MSEKLPFLNKVSVKKFNRYILLTKTTKSFQIRNARERSYDFDKDLDSSKKKKNDRNSAIKLKEK